jgi:hypothetical protein
VVRQQSAKLLCTGSNPVRASNSPGFCVSKNLAGGWWNGIHAGLKILWLKGLEGSIPSPPILSTIATKLPTRIGGSFVMFFGKTKWALKRILLRAKGKESFQGS